MLRNESLCHSQEESQAKLHKCFLFSLPAQLVLCVMLVYTVMILWSLEIALNSIIMAWNTWRTLALRDSPNTTVIAVLANKLKKDELFRASMIIVVKRITKDAIM